MHVDIIREALHKQPFQPFTLRLADGRTLPVPHRDFVAVSNRRVVVIDENAELGGGTPPPKPGGSAPERTESIGATLHDDDGQRRRWRLFRKGGE